MKACIKIVFLLFLISHSVVSEAQSTAKKISKDRSLSVSVAASKSIDKSVIEQEYLALRKTLSNSGRVILKDTP